MHILVSFIGSFYYWIKDGRKGSFFKKEFVDTNYTQKDLNKEYYAGLIITYILITIIVILSYIF